MALQVNDSTYAACSWLDISKRDALIKTDELPNQAELFFRR